MIVGLLGGVASGKSTLADQIKFANIGSFFSRSKWEVINADEISHSVLNYPHVVEAIASRWNDILINGKPNRKAIAKIVFDDIKELEFLEKLMYRDVVELIHVNIEASRADNILLDAPALLRANLKHLCNEIWFVDCPRDMRLKRYMERTKSSVDLGDDMDKRDALLMLDKGKSLASRIFDSNCPKENFIENIRVFSEQMTGR